MENTPKSITITVNYDRPLEEALKATGRNLHIDSSEVVATVPRRGIGTAIVTVEFFNFSQQFVSDDQLAKEYERGLESDLYALAAVNEADPSFADRHPNGTHWKDTEGQWCFAAFGRYNGERYLRVGRRGDEWREYWGGSGVRQLPIQVPATS